jgi:hypothetical protein
MTDEDRTEEKLEGHNCLIKFKDGEELLLKIPNLDKEDVAASWFTSVEDFLNDREQIFPYSGIALAPGTIKYVKQI